MAAPGALDPLTREAEGREAARGEYQSNREAVIAALMGGGQGGANGGLPASAPYASPGSYASVGGSSSGNLPLMGDKGPTNEALAFAKNMNPNVLEKFTALQSEFGQPLTVNSAYRDPEHNKRIGGAKNSQHMHGNALDIDVSHLSPEQRLALIQKASALGFGGIGVYNNSLHLDIGPRRAWGPSHGHESVPEWAQPAISAHMAGGQPQQRQQAPGGVQVAKAGGTMGDLTGSAPMPNDPALIEALAGSASNPFLGDGERMVMEALLGRYMEQTAPITPYQQEQLAQGDRRLAMDDAQFRAAHGLNVAQYEQARQEFMATHGLNERQFEESKGQFQADLAHRQAQLAEQQRQFDNPQPTGTMQEYDAYAAQERAAGRKPLGLMEYKLTLGGSGPSAMQERIGLLEASGLDRETAIGIAAGRLVTSRDPITGQAQIVDKGTGQVIGPMPPGAESAINNPQAAGPGGAGQPAMPPQPSPAGNLYDRTGEGTGILSGAKELSSNTLGQLPGVAGDFFSFPTTTETRQAFTAATGDLVRSFSVNPRFPVAEIQRIREQIGIEPKVWTDPEAMQVRMRSIDAYLRNKLAAEQQAANDPSLPPDQRHTAIGTARAIEQYLQLLGVPQGGPQQGQQDSGIPQPQSEQDYQALPSGSVYIAPTAARGGSHELVEARSRR